MANSPHNYVGMFFTNAGTGSEGLMDQLLLGIQEHLDKQYKAQRLQGADYARVYIASIEAALASTTQYLIANRLIEEEKAKSDKELELLDKQMEQIDQEILKTQQEIEVLKLQPALTQAQIAKIDAEILYLDAQKAMMDAQKLKIDKEIEFLDAKIRTEYANTVGSYADPSSLIGRQKSLLIAQKLGFAGDLQLKVSKLHADYQSVVMSVLELPGAQDLLGEAVGTDAKSTAQLIKNSI